MYQINVSNPRVWPAIARSLMARQNYSRGPNSPDLAHCVWFGLVRAIGLDLVGLGLAIVETVCGLSRSSELVK